ncbi:helix-turn-helix transcriptional regulator [Aneurinibacillus aneurinilyticus]|nr:YafY family protein [Aneurinibacillus aneurinilyticus]MCI1695560.1 YafY family transcriptional regulator [Aneurinibacillus aneurinilyticus]MED0706914.1 YafY family protein [Aneurinibacillus aneurinilyticus]MED0721952.1 YafY family protein [Aneurinibacillus aneurinilyticus]MED0734287.1 YafY family protein [Aneurinibacillus aneurinilyticus]MED0743363.1 YafY family protein [Aneurinibacillus aneurinilyticus]
MKIERLLGIIVLLIHRKRMKAVDLSRYFEVSERTIYRDIDSLNRAGIPIVSLPGQEGGYELMDGFKLDKKYLTLDELLSIQWALKSIEKATGFEDINELISKINQLIDSVPTQDKNIQLQISHSNNSSQHIQTIYKSIQNCSVIKIRYVDHKGNETERDIESMGIFLKDYHWYTWAYCLLRNELRVFKLTRIIETYNTNRYFTRRPYTIEDIYEKENGKSGSSIRPFTVCLQFSREMRAHVLDNFQKDEIVNNPNGTIIVKKNYYTIDKAMTQIISFGNKVRIIYPKEVIQKFIKCLDDIKKLYKD